MGKSNCKLTLNKVWWISIIFRRHFGDLWFLKSPKIYWKKIGTVWIPSCTPSTSLKPLPVARITLSYLYLSFGHNLIRHLSLLFALLGFGAALLVAQQPQGLRALQLDLKLLAVETVQIKLCKPYPLSWGLLKWLILLCISGKQPHLVPVGLCGVSVHTGLGFVDEVAVGVHLQGAVQI